MEKAIASRATAMMADIVARDSVTALQGILATSQSLSSSSDFLGYFLYNYTTTHGHDLSLLGAFVFQKYLAHCWTFSRRHYDLHRNQVIWAHSLAIIGYVFTENMLFKTLRISLPYTSAFKPPQNFTSNKCFKIFTWFELLTFP